jgi:glycosyltransferase involved in cell wall biosynthesis
MIEPRIDGRQVEFVGEATPAIKNELLANATALLFPIQWHEPFGLVMIEAMACGTPVLALPGGAVKEVVADGVSGWLCASVADMAQRARDVRIPPASCRRYVEERFSAARMAANYETLYRGCMDAPGLTSSANAPALKT